MRLSIVEIALLQVVFYAILWIWDDYIATYMCIVIPGIIAAVLVVSLLAELFEPSRISRKYFYIMGLSVVIPVLVGLTFLAIYGGQLEWTLGL